LVAPHFTLDSSQQNSNVLNLQLSIKSKEGGAWWFFAFLTQCVAHGPLYCGLIELWHGILCLEGCGKGITVKIKRKDLDEKEAHHS